MKICKICKTENKENDDICKHCGSYLGFSKFHKFLLIGLFVWPVLIYTLYLAIKDTIKIKKIREENNINLYELIFNTQKRSSEIKNTNNLIDDTGNNIFNTYFIKASNYRNKDGKIEKGNCVIEFNEENFYIKQGEKNIENPITSIYLFDIWEYEERIYFKMQMRSHTEYIFSSTNNEENKISALLSNYDVKIEDNR